MDTDDYLKSVYYLDKDEAGKALAIGADASLWGAESRVRLPEKDEPEYTLHGYYPRVKKINDELLDINKVIYRHNRKGIYWNRYCDCELLFIFHTDGVSKYVFDPTELGENLWILFKYKNSSRVRRWVLKRLNAVFVGSDGKTIGDFCTWNKHGYPVYDLTKLNEEVEKSFKEN